jgi:hypothetical protein
MVSIVFSNLTRNARTRVSNLCYSCGYQDRVDRPDHAGSRGLGSLLEVLEKSRFCVPLGIFASIFENFCVPSRSTQAFLLSPSSPTPVF